MFALVVHEPNRAPWRKAFAVRECRIGSAKDNDLVLDAKHRINGHHVRLVRKDDKFILVPMKSNGRVLVDERKLKAPVIVNERTQIMVGDVRVELVRLAYESLGNERLVPRDTREAELIAAVDDADEARLVYADWLEGNGDHAKAEVLRIQHASATDDEAQIDRVRELAAAIELPWRARLTKLPIANCVEFRFKCPLQWSALKPTAVDGERFCGQCERTVYYCATIDEARVRGAEGKCVAIDVASPRWTRDMTGPFGEAVCPKCGLDVGDGLRDCPRCGERVAYEIMEMGEVA